MRILLDTCIIIDVFQHREPFWEDSYHVMLAIANRHGEGFLTAKSFTDLYYLTHRATHNDKETRKILSTLLVPLALLDTAGIDCRKALSLEVGDYEDAVMIETAQREGLDCIVTRNQKDYARSPVPVYTPEEFLRLVSTNEDES